MAIKNIEIQDISGNAYYPHTDASVVKFGDSNVGASLSELTNKVDNIKIADGTTSQKGIVKLNDTVTSTSIIEAATANAVRQAYARADSAFQYANNGKTSIANVIGYVTGSNTHAEIANEIQNDKNSLATNLTKKNVNANGNFALKDLVNKVSEISIASLGGVNMVSGSTPISPFTNKTATSAYYENGTSSSQLYMNFSQVVSFTPKIIFCTITGSGAALCFVLTYNTVPNGGFRFYKDNGTSGYTYNNFITSLSPNDSCYLGNVTVSLYNTINWTILG